MAILYIVGTLFVSAWMPLNDAILVNAFPEGRRYSRWRALLSASYAMSAVVAGVLYATTGFTAALVVVGIGGLVLAAIAPRLPDLGRSARLADMDRRDRRQPVRDPHRRGAGRVQDRAGAAADPAGHRARRPRLHGRQHLYRPADDRTRRVASVDVGLAGSLSAAVEIPGMILAGIVATRFGLRVLFVSSGVILTVIPASWAVLTDVDLILVTRAMVGIGFAGMLVSGVLTMRSLLPSGLQGTGQTLFQATLFGFAGFVINVLGGLLYPSIGFQGLFALCAVLAGCGVVVGWVAYGHAKRDGSHA